MVTEFLTKILNVNLSDCQWSQATLPVKSREIGVRSAVMLATSAFLPSDAGSYTAMSQLQRFGGDVDDIWYNTALHIWTVDGLERTQGAQLQDQKVWDFPQITLKMR